MEHYNNTIKLIKENEEERDADEISKKVLGLMAIHTVVDKGTITFNGEGAVTALDFFVAIKIGSQDCFLALRKHGMPFPPFDENGIDHMARYRAANDVDKCDPCDAEVYKKKQASEFIRGHFVGNATQVLQHPSFPRKVEEWTKTFLAEKENAMANLPSSYVGITMYAEAVLALSEFDKSYDKDALALWKKKKSSDANPLFAATCAASDTGSPAGTSGAPGATSSRAGAVSSSSSRPTKKYRSGSLTTSSYGAPTSAAPIDRTPSTAAGGPCVAVPRYTTDPPSSKKRGLGS
jgi:hypothetical protein